LEQFAREINAIASEAQPDSIRVIYCDAAVQGVEEFCSLEPIKLASKGGGGTDFVPPFKGVEENCIERKCLVYLTDLCCNSFPPAPDYPVLWVTDSRKTAPFGETLGNEPWWVTFGWASLGRRDRKSSAVFECLAERSRPHTKLRGGSHRSFGNLDNHDSLSDGLPLTLEFERG
jgi:hypothetical protein